MFLILLTISLSLLLLAVLLGNSTLFALAVVSSIVSLTGVSGVPRRPLLVFWIWVNLVLLYLISEPSGTGYEVRLVAGIPVSAFWMLLGIWLIPVFLWPLVFYAGFKDWVNR